MITIKRSLVTAACLGLFVAGVAFPIDHPGSIGAALAKDGGGNGKGGGEGNGKGGGQGKSGGDHGKSSDRGNSAKAHDKSKADKASVDVDDDDDGDDSGLGALNAAHASARARDRAAPNSAVGKIATYERSRDEAMALTDPALREQALDDAVADLEAAFGRTLTDEQVDRIDELLDARQ
jgi:hypothetical protein